MALQALIELSFKTRGYVGAAEGIEVFLVVLAATGNSSL